MGILTKKLEPVLTTGRHDTIRQNDPYAFQVAHRRLAWMLRLSVGTNIVLAISLVTAMNAFAAIFPLKEVRVALLRVDPQENKLYRVEPISEDVEGFQLLLEQKARRYVRNMLEIDRITQGERFKEAFAMTDDRFYKRFWKERVESEEIKGALDSGLTRSITVESVDRIETNDPVHKLAVDFVQTDVRAGRIIEETPARAYLTMTTRPEEVRPEDRFENPLGIVVLDMVLKEKANK